MFIKLFAGLYMQNNLIYAKQFLQIEYKFSITKIYYNFNINIHF